MDTTENQSAFEPPEFPEPYVRVEGPHIYIDPPPIFFRLRQKLSKKERPTPSQ